MLHARVIQASIRVAAVGKREVGGMDRKQVFEALAAICMSGDPEPAVPQVLQGAGRAIGLFETPADKLRWRSGLPDRPMAAAVLRLGARLTDLGLLKLADTQLDGMLQGFAARIRPETVALPPGAGPVDVAGFHPDRFLALTACVGEAAEYLSQLMRPGDIRTGGPDGVEEVTGVDFADGTPVDVPARECLIFPSADPSDPHRLSSGCAAGPTIADAADRAVLELIERDAVAGWWDGGRPAVRLEAGARLTQDLLGFERALRGPAGCGRVTTFYDIRQEIDLPVIAAVSFRPDGSGFAAGYAARRSLAEAGRRAICEMMQMEFGQEATEEIFRAKGPGALDQTALRQLLRARHVTFNDMTDRSMPGRADADRSNDFEGPVRAAIAPSRTSKSVAVTIVNLTRHSVGWPVAKAHSGDLRKIPADPFVEIPDLALKPGFPIPLF